MLVILGEVAHVHAHTLQEVLSFRKMWTETRVWLLGVVGFGELLGDRRFTCGT
jgi:hypothetical protein